MHYAIHGHTAAEHILERADHQKQNMGLMTWQDAPDGKIKKSDVIIAKNYLSEFELSQLNRMWLHLTWILLKIWLKENTINNARQKQDLMDSLKCLNMVY